MAVQDVVKTSALGFVSASWTLLASKEHRLGAEWFHKPFVARVQELSVIQSLALSGIFVTLLILVGFTGYAFLEAHKRDQEEKDEIALQKKLNKGPSTAVKAFCTVVSAVTVVGTLVKGMERYKLQRNMEEWPASFGLFCGLGSVAVAQVVLIIYQGLRRAQLLGSEEHNTIQLKPLQYERTFLQDIVHHLSNPGAFLLMAPYLCLTWMFRLMPDSYYNYDAPTNWWNVLAQLVVVDFFTFAFHVAEHCMPEFYKISHKPHHRFVAPHFFNAFDGSLADTIALILFPLFATAQLLHVNNWDYVAFGTVYSTHFMLIHSEFSHAIDPLLEFFYVNVAEDHHVHHAIFNSNFSHFFTFYDRLAGTYRSGSSCKGFRSYTQTSVSPLKQQ